MLCVTHHFIAPSRLMLDVMCYAPFYRPLLADAWCYVLRTILSPPPGWCLMLCVTHHFIAPSRLMLDVMCYAPFYRPPPGWCLVLCVTHHFVAPSWLMLDVMCYSPFCRPLQAGVWCCPLIQLWIVLCRETLTCDSQSVMEKKKNFSLNPRQLRTPKKPLDWWTSRLTQRL